MPGKRKRHRPKLEASTDRPNEASPRKADAVAIALLPQFYPKVVTLRDYLLSGLPVHARQRRRKITIAGHNHGATTATTELPHRSGSPATSLAVFLDTTLVGVLSDTPVSDDIMRRWYDLHDKKDVSELTFNNEALDTRYLQSEVDESPISIPRIANHIQDCRLCDISAS
jgi:telomerase reverse transcriptase